MNCSVRLDDYAGHVAEAAVHSDRTDAVPVHYGAAEQGSFCMGSV